MNRLFGLLVFVVLGGCTTNPAIEYRVIQRPEDMADMSDSFYLRRSALEITATESQATDVSGNKVVETKIAVRPILKEHQEVRYAIGGRRDLTASTRINVTKLDNTDLINSIGVVTTDSTKTNIEQAGGVIVKLISLVGMLAAPETPCIGSKKGKFVFELNPSETPQDFNAGRPGCVSVTYGPLPRTAIPAARLPVGRKTRNFYFAACRDATVEIQQTSSEKIKEQVKVSDPNFLDYVRFPAKGKVQHHSSCGTSVVTEESPTANPADIVGALQAQASAIEAALKATKND